MKKILFITLASCLSFILHAQNVVHDKVNSLNKRVMYTDWVMTNWNSDIHKLEIGMLLEGNVTSLTLNWQCPEMLGVERNSNITLRFSDQTAINLKSKAFAVSGIGKVRTDQVSSSVMGIQIDAKGDLSHFLDKTLSSITITTTSGVIYFPVTKEEALNLNKLYKAFASKL